MSSSGKPVKVSVAKETANTRIGLTFRQDADEDILINTIAPDSLFANTRLRPGMEVLRINNVATDCLSLAQCMKTMKDAPDVITIEACAIQKETTKQDRIGHIPVASAPYRPDPEPMTGDDIEAQYNGNSNEDPSLIVLTSDRVHAVDDNNDIPVANAQIMSNSTRTVHAVPTAYATDASPVTSSSATTTIKKDVVNPDGSITVTARKSTQETKAGIGLKNQPGVGVVITSIKTYSVFTGTSLRAGMKVLKVNGSDVTQQSAQYAATLMGSVAGDVTIVATNLYDSPHAAAPVASVDHSLTTAIITKPSRESIVGITVYDKATDWGTRVPVISKIAADGPAGNSTLQPGMRVLSINGISCRNRDDTVAMLRMANAGELTIVAGPLRMVAATVTKTTRDTKVGISMQRLTTGGLYVTKLKEDGLFGGKTDLKEGMQVVQINGVDVNTIDTSEVLGVIAAAEGTVTVLALDVSTEKANGEEINGDGPPPGAPPGGEWGRGNFFGPTNSLWYCIICSCCGIFGLCTLCCKCDTETMYRAPNGHCYSVQGKYRGTESAVQFRHNPPGVLGPADQPVSEIEKSCGPNYVQILVALGTFIWLLWVVIGVVVRVNASDDNDDYYYYSSNSCGYKYCYEYDYSTSSYEYRYVYRCGSC